MGEAVVELGACSDVDDASIGAAVVRIVPGASTVSAVSMEVAESTTGEVDVAVLVSGDIVVTAALEEAVSAVGLLEEHATMAHEIATSVDNSSPLLQRRALGAATTEVGMAGRHAS